MALFQKDVACLGVDIGAHGIKVVELHAKKGRPQLWTYGMMDEPLDIHVDHLEEKTTDALMHETSAYMSEKTKKNPPVRELSARNKTEVRRYADMLRHVCKEARVTTKHAVASLPVSQIFHAVITLPLVEQKKIPTLVQAEIAKMLPLPISDMQVAFQIITRPKDEPQSYHRILVTAAPRSLVAFYTAIFSAAGLELTTLETEAFALERSLVGKDPTTAMVVDIGAERTNFFIIDMGLPVTHRSIHIGGQTMDEILMKKLQVSKELVDQMKRDMAKNNSFPQGIFAEPIAAIAKEIEYGFDLYLQQIGHEKKRPEKIILTGGSAMLPDIRTTLQKTFSMKIFVGDPWARVVHQEGLRLILDAIGPRMGVAIGLALRSLVQETPHT